MVVCFSILLKYSTLRLLNDHAYHNIAFIGGPLKWEWRLQMVGHVTWGDSRARFLICRSCCSVGRTSQMEGKREHFETPFSLFSSAVSPTREIGVFFFGGGSNLAVAWHMLRRQSGLSAAVIPRHLCQFGLSANIFGYISSDSLRRMAYPWI